MTGRIQRLAMLLCGLAFAAGCGPSATPPDRSTGPDTGPDTGRPSPEMRFAARQQAMCDALAPRITTCAVEQARKNLTERELEKQGLNDSAFLRKYTNDIRSDCTLKEISTRQIKVSEDCTARESDCETFLNCLDGARKKANET